MAVPGLGFVAVVSVLGAIVLGALFFGVARLAGLVTSTAFVIGAVIAAGFLVIMTLWAAFVRLQARQDAVWLRVWHTTLSGRLPADADVDVWRPRLRSRRRSWALMRIVAVIEFGLFTGLAVFLVASGSRDWWTWVELVIFPAFGVLGFWQAGRQLTRIDGALAELEDRQRI